jgi:GMP synthase (glutamine-hydrolysing)
MRILYLVNEINSGPGVLLEEATAAGAEARLIFTLAKCDLVTGEHADVPETSEGYDALVAMGGIMGVYEEAKYPFIDRTRKLMRRFHQERKPVMGVCLGAQTLASAFGARVTRMAHDEWGFLPHTWEAAAKDDPLLHDAEPGLSILQWHSDTFEMPEGAVRLATRETCANQSFRLGPLTYAFQFHLELTRETLEIWVHERAKGKRVAVDEIRAEIGPVEAVLEPQQAFARRVMGRWMELAE